MDNIKMMMPALFMQHKSEFPLWLFGKKKKKKEKIALKKDYFKCTDLSVFKETAKFMTPILTFKVLFNMSAQINGPTQTFCVFYQLKTQETFSKPCTNILPLNEL